MAGTVLAGDVFEPGLGDVRLVLYRLPVVLAQAARSGIVFVAEGEKCAEALERLELVATTAPLGAGKWRPEFAAMLAGAVVVAIPDCDRPGRLHALDVLDTCHVSSRCKVLEPLELGWHLPEGWDVVDELAGVAATLHAVEPDIDRGDTPPATRARAPLDTVAVPVPARRLPRTRHRTTRKRHARVSRLRPPPPARPESRRRLLPLRSTPAPMSDDERDRVRAHAREHYLPALRNDRHPNARTLLAVLLCLLRPDGTASLSYEFLAHVTGIPRGKVSVVLAELERRGMLERTPGRPSTGRGRPRNVYRVPTNIGHGPSVFSATATVAYNGEVRVQHTPRKK